MNWLSRHLRKPGLTHRDDGRGYVRQHQEPRRPQTAPSSGAASKHVEFTFSPDPPVPRPHREPPPRPPRPDSGVIQDVNAWLDATIVKPGPVLMSGIPYWREGDGLVAGMSSGIRYATPIVRHVTEERPVTSPNQKDKALVRIAKKIQVHMPTLLRTRSQRNTIIQRNPDYRRSRSMPILAPSSELLAAETPQAAPRSRSLVNVAQPYTPTIVSSLGEGSVRKSETWAPSTATRLESSASVRFDEQELSMERRVNSVFGSSPGPRGGGIRRVPVSRMPREDSMGNLSDAPSYATGPPPPSYRSRAESRMTTSSFGCVDRMNAQRRQLSHQRAVQRSRGVKGTFRKLAQRAHLSR
ncbi:hypothetical protein K491DRAFT_594436 [Lophiostoma macrostomum CBS 122681]|uniref:Uncharacterized protein n=1 Tax=Lophiostoma macrostomum CBS 122681 TaxID=1314788 RepID=A0A6A6TCG9_9PLEO|nr:hypothetical protein K491DRAFT_594436 [Lophiostoma macrostomum CBS 122681]